MYPVISLMSLSGWELAQYMGILDALVGGLLGYIVVFVGLALLMVVIMGVGKLMVSAQSKAPSPDCQAPVATTSSSTAIPAAPGSAGQVKLYDVPDKEAALLMAIVADKMGKPLNELRFKSIKEVK